MKQINNSLSDEQKSVLFDAATEAPFSGKLLHNKKSGIYSCANCKAKLFTSERKFDSGCGWPSFDDAIEGSITTRDDTSHGMTRTEITCANCGGHLGHVFPDGPKPTGERYCINSLAMVFSAK